MCESIADIDDYGRFLAADKRLFLQVFGMPGRVLRDYCDISVQQDDLRGPIDFDDLFGRGGEVHIEIGSGKGTFLVNQSRFEPEVNFLGIEWAGRYYRLAVDRLGRWDVGNVRIIRTDAAVFLAEFIKSSSVSCFHIYFPDPWPKKRHNKRRFFCESNLHELLRCLKIGGRIQFATDHADYFEQVREVVDGATNLVDEVEFIRAGDARDDELVGTNYERKYLVEGRAVYSVALLKK